MTDTSQIFSDQITRKYEIYEFRHASTIFKNDYPEEYKQLTDLLETFQVTYDDIQTPGGRKSPIASALKNGRDCVKTLYRIGNEQRLL